MNQQQIDFIKSLDPQNMNGTIQNILLGNIGDINSARFETVLQYLVKSFMSDREVYKEENKRMRDILIKHNLYDANVLGR